MPPFLAALLRLGRADGRKLGLALGGFAAALVLALLAVARLVDAIALAFLELLHPALASLATALVVALIALALFGVARLWLQVAVASGRKRSSDDLSAATVAVMLARLKKLVRTNKKEAALAAVLAGVLASAVLEGEARSRNDRRERG